MVFDEVGGYREQCEFWEDQDLVVRMAAVSKVAVIPRPLYCVRQSTTSTRVVSDQERLERALDRVYRASDRVKRGKEYEDLLSPSGTTPTKLDPRAFIALGSVRLWAGGRPRLFRRLLGRAKLSLDTRTASAILWTAWASANPPSLRVFLMLLLKARNGFARRVDTTRRALQWQPLSEAQPLEEDQLKL